MNFFMVNVMIPSVAKMPEWWRNELEKVREEAVMA
jgi:hypothetical protein